MPLVLRSVLGSLLEVYRPLLQETPQVPLQDQLVGQPAEDAQRRCVGEVVHYQRRPGVRERQERVRVGKRAEWPADLLVREQAGRLEAHDPRGEAQAHAQVPRLERDLIPQDKAVARGVQHALPSGRGGACVHSHIASKVEADGRRGSDARLDVHDWHSNRVPVSPLVNGFSYGWLWPWAR